MAQQTVTRDSASAPKRQPVQMMISYAHKDEKLRMAFEDHLAILRNHKLVDIWNDRQIGAGGRWDTHIKDSLNSADIVLLLVSPALFASKYVTGVELAGALAREKRGEASVIPIILREGDYGGSPFSHLKELPTDGLAEGRSVTGKRWKNKDEAFRNVTEGLRREVERLWGKRLEQHAVQASLAKQNREPSREDREEIRSIGETFGRVVAGRRVLWVDDHPENNVVERAALEVLGVAVETETTTPDGLRALESGTFDLVISDWVRGQQKKNAPSEGMRLLLDMRQAHTFIPMIFYCGWLSDDQLADRRSQVARAGGSGLTAAPRELLRWTIGELVRCAAFDPKAPFVEPPLYAADTTDGAPTPRKGRAQKARGRRRS
jgi:CheY-like chemotaxis protein